jgi:hypothetical protein
MPLKLNVGVSRKIGLPDYGSAGASLNLELELEASLLETDLDGFHRRVQAAYREAQRALAAEIARVQAQVAGVQTDARPAMTNGYGPHNNHGSHGVPSGHVPSVAIARPSRPATAGQVRAIYAIARQAGANLAELLAEHGVARPDDLGAKAASTLIDRLKAQVTD